MGAGAGLRHFLFCGPFGAFSFLWPLWGIFFSVAPLAFAGPLDAPSETMYLKIYEIEPNIVQSESVSLSDVSDSLRPHGL